MKSFLQFLELFSLRICSFIDGIFLIQLFVWPQETFSYCRQYYFYLHLVMQMILNDLKTGYLLKDYDLF